MPISTGHKYDENDEQKKKRFKVATNDEHSTCNSPFQAIVGVWGECNLLKIKNETREEKNILTHTHEEKDF